jgi:hypothetical protein
MFTEPRIFLPKRHDLLARQARRSPNAETIFPTALNSTSKGDPRSLDRVSLNKIIAALGTDGAVEFIGAGFSRSSA